MSPPKYTTYELKLEGDADIINFLAQHLPDNHATIAGANAHRRAIATLFGDAITCDVMSVRRVPARTVRRKLRI
jgi:hypothetical protein